MRMSSLSMLTELAAAQWGLVTTAQAQQAGISRMQLTRLVDSGILDRVAHGVYATPAVLGDELLGLRAAWIALQPSRSVSERLGDPVGAGVVSHTSAAQLHGLGDLLADEHEFTLPSRYQSTRAGVRVHRSSVTPADATLVAGLPTTTPARTVVDLLADGYDFQHVGQVAADAVRKGSTDGRALAQALAPVARRHGARDGAALTSQLLQAGGLVPRELGDSLIATDAGVDLIARALDDRLARSPETAKLVQDLVTIAAAASGSPELRAGLAKVAKTAERSRATLDPINAAVAQSRTSALSATRARLAVSLLSADTRQEDSAWFADPNNQAVLQQLELTIRTRAEAHTAAHGTRDMVEHDVVQACP